MKNICFFNSRKVWGGGEKWHAEMARRLSRAGYRVLVIANRPSELAARLAGENVLLRQMKISNVSFCNAAKMLHIRNLLRRERIQAIFLNSSADLKVGGLAAQWAGVAKIIYRRGVALPVKNTMLNRWLLRSIVTAVIVNSAESGRILLQENAQLLPPAKMQIIYNGIDQAAYDQEPARPLYARIGNEIILGSAGRLAEEKGQKYLIELARMLKAQDVPFKLLIAGKGKLAAELKHNIRKLDVDKEVQLVGFVENIKSFLASIDIFVLPSLYEGGANVLLEAMAAQKPVVAFDASSNPEFIIHRQTGLLAKKGDLADLAACVNLLLRDAGQRTAFGKQARQIVAEKFTIERAVKEVISLIEA